MNMILDERYQVLNDLMGFNRVDKFIYQGWLGLPDGSRLNPDDRRHYERLRSQDYTKEQIGLRLTAIKTARLLGVSENRWYPISKRLTEAGLIKVNGKDPDGYYIRWQPVPLTEVVFSIFWRYWFENVTDDTIVTDDELRSAFEPYWVQHGQAISQKPELYAETWKRNNEKQARKDRRGAGHADPLVIAGFLAPGESMNEQLAVAMYDREYRSFAEFLHDIGGVQCIVDEDIDPDRCVPWLVGKGVVTICGLEFPELQRDDVVLRWEEDNWAETIPPEKHEMVMRLIEMERNGLTLQGLTPDDLIAMGFGGSDDDEDGPSEPVSPPSRTVVAPTQIKAAKTKSGKAAQVKRDNLVMLHGRRKVAPVVGNLATAGRDENTTISETVSTGTIISRQAPTPTVATASAANQPWGKWAWLTQCDALDQEERAWISRIIENGQRSQKVYGMQFSWDCWEANPDFQQIIAKAQAQGMI